MTAQATQLIACDFLHVDTVLLRRIYVLIFIEHGTRQLHVAGFHPTAHWVAQQARNLAMDMEERLESLTFLIRDRDSKFTVSFDAIFAAAGIRILRSPPQAPRPTPSANEWSARCAASSWIECSSSTLGS